MIKKLLTVCVVALVLFTSVSTVFAWDSDWDSEYGLYDATNHKSGISVEDWIVQEYKITRNCATLFIESRLPSFNNKHQDTTFNLVDLPVVGNIHKIIKDIDKDGDSAK